MADPTPPSGQYGELFEAAFEAAQVEPNWIEAFEPAGPGHWALLAEAPGDFVGPFISQALTTAHPIYVAALEAKNREIERLMSYGNCYLNEEDLEQFRQDPEWGASIFDGGTKIVEILSAATHDKLREQLEQAEQREAEAHQHLQTLYAWIALSAQVWCPMCGKKDAHRSNCDLVAAKNFLESKP